MLTTLQPNVYYQDQNTHQLTMMRKFLFSQQTPNNDLTIPLESTFNIYYFFDRNGPNEVTQAFPEGLKVTYISSR